jgi:hypothetical protein
MKCVKVESYVVEARTDRHSPSKGGLQVAVTGDGCINIHHQLPARTEFLNVKAGGI